MDSNEQNELTSKTDRLIDGKQDDSWGVGMLAGGRIGQNGKELIDINNSVVIAGGGRDNGTKW